MFPSESGVELSLMVAPSAQTPIQGEPSVCRYLARLLRLPYDQGCIAKASEIDGLLDLHQALTKGNGKEKAAVVRALNGRLGKSAWLVGEEMSLADIVLWSALMQSGQGQVGIKIIFMEFLGMQSTLIIAAYIPRWPFASDGHGKSVNQVFD